MAVYICYGAPVYRPAGVYGGDHVRYSGVVNGHDAAHVKPEIHFNKTRSKAGLSIVPARIIIMLIIYGVIIVHLYMFMSRFR